MVNTETDQRMVMEAGSQDPHDTEGILMSGYLAETVVGIGVIVLSILALLGVFRGILPSVSIIAIGSALVVGSRAIASRFNELSLEMTGGTEATVMGMTTQLIAGIAGIALGVLSLLGIAGGVLEPVAVIVFGLSLLYGVGVQNRLNELEIRCDTGSHEATRMVAHEAVSIASGVQVLVGIGAATLGILSLIGLGAPIILTLVALLAIGGSMLFSGGAVSTRMLGFTTFCEQPHHAV